jgi:hypothetical protein
VFPQCVFAAAVVYVASHNMCRERRYTGCHRVEHQFVSPRQAGQVVPAYRSFMGRSHAVELTSICTFHSYQQLPGNMHTVRASEVSSVQMHPCVFSMSNSSIPLTCLRILGERDTICSQLVDFICWYQRHSLEEANSVSDLLSSYYKQGAAIKPTNQIHKYIRLVA